MAFTASAIGQKPAGFFGDRKRDAGSEITRFWSMTARPSSRWGVDPLSDPDLHVQRLQPSVIGQERDVGRIATVGHDDPAAARGGLRGVEGVPAAVQVGLEPGMQVHRLQPMQVSHHHAGGNAQAPAQGDADMGVVAADAGTGFHGAECVGGGIAHAVAVFDMRADPFHDRADLAAAGVGGLHDGLRQVERAIARAVAARQQVLQGVIGQARGRHRRDPRGDGDVALGLDFKFGADAHAPARHDEALTEVAEHVDELGRPDMRLERIRLADQPLRLATAWPQHGDHRTVLDGFYGQLTSG